MTRARRTAVIALMVVILIYGTIIMNVLSGTGPDVRAVAWLLVGVMLVGISSAAIARFRAVGVARGLSLMAASQIAAGLVMIWQGIGTPWVITTASVVLALVVVTLAWVVRRYAGRD